MKHRVLICGDREWTDETTIRVVILGLKDKWGKDLTIINGYAPGADLIAAKLSQSLGIDTECYPARWDAFGKRAGPMRNQQMLDSGVDEVWAFHDHITSSKGTKDMVQRASKAKVPVTVVRGWRP
jgi:hypothetical protein